METVFDCTSDS